MSLSLNPSSTPDQYIRYPNDLSLVNEARLKSEKIDQLYILLKDEFPVKPRTYRKVAHQRYSKSVRKAIRYLLNCV
jgi:hypothetical protein